jgi:hypothetical protein
VIAFYGKTLKFVLRFQTITLLVALATLAADRFSVLRNSERLLSRFRIPASFRAFRKPRSPFRSAMSRLQQAWRR